MGNQKKSAYQPNIQKASRNYPLVTLFGILSEPWSLTPKYSYMPYTQVLFETYTLKPHKFADVFMMLTKLHGRQHTKFYLLKSNRNNQLCRHAITLSDFLSLLLYNWATKMMQQSLG